MLLSLANGSGKRCVPNEHGHRTANLSPEPRAGTRPGCRHGTYLPPRANRALFADLARLGRELCELHLLESLLLGKNPVSYPVAGDNRVEKAFPKYKDARVFLNATQYFGPVAEEVWTFSVGGYQPAEKWLKDRRGRVLTHTDLQHYKHLLAAQRESLRVMTEIEENFPYGLCNLSEAKS